MPELDDQQLLREFAKTNSETAFAALVARHVNLVYSTALRFCGNPHRAEEVTQAVFIILARKAKSLGGKTVLSGWLYQTARMTAANVVKGEIRRQRREQEAYMQSTLNEPDPAAWEQIAPLLDDAMGRLGEIDRNAVVLRFFENKTAREVAAALQLTEAAAHKRVNRALDKLRKFFTKRGVIHSAAIIAGAVSANSVQAAPVGLAKTISAVAVAKGAVASTSTLTLVKGALKIMAWTKMKTAVVVSGVALLTVGTLTVTVVRIQQNTGAQSDKGKVPAASPVQASSSKEVNERNADINNLRQIDAAKMQWALENGKPNGTPATESDIAPYLIGGKLPKSPAGGTYTIGKVGETPTCSIPGHELP